MSDDRDFKIRISTVADTSGITQQNDALKELGGTSEKTNAADVEGTAKATLGKHELRSAMRLLGHEFGALGGMVHFLFSPWTIAIGAVLVVTRLLKSANEELDATIKRLADSTGDLTKGYADIEEAAIKADKAFHSSLEAAERDGKSKLSTLEAEKKAVEAVMAAREKLEMSQAKTPEEKEGIRNRYEMAKEGRESEFEQKRIGLLQEKLDNLIIQQHIKDEQADKFAPGMDLTDIQKELSKAKMKPELQAKAKAADEAAEKSKPSFGDYFNPAFVSGQHLSDVHIAEMLHQQVAKLPSERGLTIAETAKTESLNLQKAILDLAAELQTARRNAGIGSSASHSVGQLNALAGMNANPIDTTDPSQLTPDNARRLGEATGWAKKQQDALVTAVVTHSKTIADELAAANAKIAIHTQQIANIRMNH